MKPEVSIVLPIYKPQTNYLAALFNSIVQQTFQNFELIISDDFDDRQLVFNHLPHPLLDKTKYFNNPGSRGIFCNLNYGLQQAEGDLIQIFCQDDIMLPTLLESNVLSLKNDPEAGLVFTSLDLMDEHGQIRKFNRPDIDFIPSVIHPENANNYFLYFGCMPGNLSSVMVRNSLFISIGYFNTEYKFAGDFEFWVRASNAVKILFSKTSLLLIRDHSLRASKTLGTLKRFKEISIINKYLIENNTIQLPRKVLRRYLHIHLFRSISSFLVKHLFVMKKEELDDLRHIFNNGAYSVLTSVFAYFHPYNQHVRKLKEIMEVKRI